MLAIRQLILVFLKMLLAILAFFAVILTAHLVIVYFGPNLKFFPFRLLIKSLAESVTINFTRQSRVKTPYSGYFDLNTLFTLLFYLLLEPVVEKLRRSVEAWHPIRKAG
jgi:hypothetical protein